MRPIVFFALILAVGGCTSGSASGGSSTTRWRIQTDFTLNEVQNGDRVSTSSGLHFRVQISTDSPDCFYWELSYYDGAHFDVVDHWHEEHPEGLCTVWILKTRDPGDCWLEFSEYPYDGATSTQQVTYFFDIY